MGGRREGEGRMEGGKDGGRREGIGGHIVRAFIVNV